MSEKPELVFTNGQSDVAKIYQDNSGSIKIEALVSNNIIVESLRDENGNAFTESKGVEEIFLAHIATTNGVSTPNDTYFTLPYNTVEENSIPGASFDTATHELSLPAGLYYVDSYHNFYSGDSDASIRLYDPDNNTQVLQGSMGYANNSSFMTISGLLNLSSTTNMIMQLRSDDGTSWGAGVVRDDNIPTTETPYAGNFYIEKID